MDRMELRSLHPDDLRTKASASARRRAAVVVVLACAAIAALAAGAAGAGAPAPARLSLQWAEQPPPQMVAQQQLQAATNLSPEQWAAASRAVYAQTQSAYVTQPHRMVAQQQLQEAPSAPQAPPVAQVAPQAPSAPLLVAPNWARAPVPSTAPASALQEAPSVPPPPSVPPAAPPDQPAAKDWSKIGGGDVSARAGGNGFGSAGPTSAAEGGDESIEDYQKVKKERRFAMDFCDAKFNSWANIQKCIHLLFSACYFTPLLLSVLAPERDTRALLFSCSICFFVRACLTRRPVCKTENAHY